MKKKPIFIFSAVVALVLALTLVACKPQHEHDYSMFDSDENEHWLVCANAGCDKPKAEEGPHVDDDSDFVCDICRRSIRVPVSGISLNKTELELAVGSSFQLLPTINPENATGYGVKWWSSEPGVADVNGSGLVTAKWVGSTTIYAQADRITVQCRVTVVEATVRVQNVTLPATYTVGVGNIGQLLPIFEPNNATNRKVTWKSDDETVASVNEYGYITGKKAGATNITVTTEDGNKTATCRVTVVIPVESVRIDQKSDSDIALGIGESASLTATVLPENATNKKIIWRSNASPLGCVTVDEDGTVHAVSSGVADIVAETPDGKYDTVVVVVTAAVTGVEFEETEITLPTGETTTLTPVFAPAGATNKNVTWESSDESVATVDRNGVVTAVGGGVATVTVTTEDGDFTAECVVTVPVGVTGVAFAEQRTMIRFMESKKLEVEVFPADATNKNIRFNIVGGTGFIIDEEGNITTENGPVYGPAVVMVITEDGNYTDTCEVELFVALEGVYIEYNVSGRNPTEIRMLVGQQLNDFLLPNFTPDNATNKNGTWGSTNENVVTVDRNGNVTAVGEGSAFVTLTAEEGNHQAKSVPVIVSHYLQFTESADGESYYVTGIDGAFNDYLLKIPATYRGKPVTAILNDGTISAQSSNVRGIQIPVSVTGIGGNVFYNNRYNTYVNYEGTLAQWLAIEGLGCLFNAKDKSSIKINCLDEENAVDLMDEAMQNTLLEIPDGVTRIEEKAFYHTKVRKLSLPASLNYIGPNAFTRDDYTSTEIEFRGTIDEWVQIEGWKTAIDRYYHYSVVTVDGVALNDMETIEITEATKIVEGAFYNGTLNRNVFVDPRAKNESLVTVILSDTVEEIGEDAFRNCVNLTNIVIGTGMTKIKESFEYTNLTNVYYKGDKASWDEIEKSDIVSYSPLQNGTATIYFYCEGEAPDDGGHYWHYNNGEIEIL